MDTDDRASLLRSAAEHAIGWLAALESRSVAATTSHDELRARFDIPLPPAGGDAGDVIDELVAATEGGLVGSPGGRFFGWVIGGTHPAGLAADWLVSAWDQNAAMAASSPAEAVIEEVAGRWMLELLGLPAEASFAFTSGSQFAHLTALAAARHQLLTRLGLDPEVDGLTGGPQLHVATGEHGHHSIDRATRLLGIGSRHLHHIPTIDNRTDADALANVLSGLGDAPTVVCLSAGDINTGNFDNFRQLIPLCRSRPHTWVHIDGAFGLWANVSPRFAHLLDGVAEADSWVTDGHKWLNTPFDIGYVATRHPQAHRNAMSIRASYLTHSADVRDQIDWTPEWSRRGRGVPVYAVIKALGRHGIAEMIDRCCDAAATMTAGIGTLSHAEVLSEAVTNQGLVRFLDPAGINHDAFTDRIIDHIQADGTVWFGGTDWHGSRAMRISVCSWATGPDDARAAIEAVDRVLTEAIAQRDRDRT